MLLEGSAVGFAAILCAKLNIELISDSYAVEDVGDNAILALC